GAAATHLRRRGLRHRARERSRSASRGGAHNERDRRLAWLPQLPGLGVEHEARAAGEPRGLLSLEPRAPGRARWYSGPGGGARACLRRRGCRSVAVAVQPAAGGDGALRRRGHWSWRPVILSEAKDPL